MSRDDAVPETGVREVEVTAADRQAGREHVASSSRWVVPAGLVIVCVLDIVAGLVVQAVAPSLHGLALALTIAITAVTMIAPLIVVMAANAKRRALDRITQTLARERAMRVEARRREFETRLANALEMAESESEAMRAAARALRHIAPDKPVEILLADNSHAHLERSLVTGPLAAGPGCTVESPSQCVAARRGQTQVYRDSEDLDACPKLSDREMGRCAAACVPVSIMGRTVGVVHTAAPLPVAMPEATVDALEVLANQVGARLGMVRMMSETRLAADTDGLTGLANRRAFENRVRQLRQAGAPFTAVMGDLDHFKRLNDTYGHEAGDRALRVFANVLRNALRPTDLYCRHGGEEFAIVLPDCRPADAVPVCDRIREELALVLLSGDSPPFTCSFGLAASADDLSFDEIMALADAALYDAKESGRNRVVVHQDGMRTAPRAPSLSPVR
jgi:diguanylate cyclase (GGDEF)-like protein